VHQLALTETLETENLRVGGEGISGDLIGVGSEETDDTTGLVDSSVLIEGIDIDLEVLGGLGETKRVKTAVTGKRAIEPIRADGVGEPQFLTSCIRGKERRRWVSLQQG
jgi:hypothetical protein